MISLPKVYRCQNNAARSSGNALNTITQWMGGPASATHPRSVQVSSLNASKHCQLSLVLALPASTFQMGGQCALLCALLLWSRLTSTPPIARIAVGLATWPGAPFATPNYVLRIVSWLIGLAVVNRGAHRALLGACAYGRSLAKRDLRSMLTQFADWTARSSVSPIADSTRSYERHFNSLFVQTNGE